MPAILLIGIPIAVAVLLFGIMSLPDEVKPEAKPKEEFVSAKAAPEKKSVSKKTKKKSKK